MTLLSVLLIVTNLFTDPSATQVGVGGQYGESTYAINGDRQGGFNVAAQSVHDIDSTHRVFGHASYQWNQSHGNRYVENADYELLCPYLTVDTIGGGMRTETYLFRGGYRMHRRHLLWHAALQYRALQSYRDVDPRPKNKVADLRVDAGIGFTRNDYAYMIIAMAGRYKQNNDIKFYSELGESQIYHLVGPGVAYTRFSGSRKESYYHGWTAGVTAAVMPHDAGWIAQLDYSHFTATKELHDNTYIPIGRIRSHAIDLSAGYTTPTWRALIDGGALWNNGQQFIYGEAVNNTYTLLTTMPNYARQTWHLGAHGEYTLRRQHSTPQTSALRSNSEAIFTADVHYHASRTSAPAPEQRWSELHDLLTDNRLLTSLGIQYSLPINTPQKQSAISTLSWFILPQAQLCYYTHTTHHTWQVSLTTGICF